MFVKVFDRTFYNTDDAGSIGNFPQNFKYLIENKAGHQTRSEKLYGL